jgi:hypothetical protein
MKFIKSYENIKRLKGITSEEPKIGDYAAAFSIIPKLNKYLSNKIGIIVEFENDSKGIPKWATIQYDKSFPKEFLSPLKIPNSRSYLIKNILFHSPNKEDCETYLSSKIYNI